MNDRNGSCCEDPGKRQAILDEAIRTFAELGFRGTDVQVIADRAGVGKGTVYRYFRSKDELFWTTTLEVILRMDRHLFAAMEGVEGACNKLRASAIAHAKFFEANPSYLELIIQDRAEFHGSRPKSHDEHHKNMLDRVSVILRQGIEAGELRPIDTRQTTLAMGCLLFGTAMLAGRVEFVRSGRDDRIRHRHFPGRNPTRVAAGYRTFLSHRKPTIMNAALADRPQLDRDLPHSEPTNGATLELVAPPDDKAAPRRPRWGLIAAIVVVLGVGGGPVVLVS